MGRFEIAGSYSSPRWTTEFADCAIPLSFDQYSVCAYGCFYCFSQFQRGIGAAKEDYLRKVVKAVKPESFKRMFAPDYDGQFRDYLQSRMVMQWGGLSDPFCEVERELGVGLDILGFLREREYPVCFSTKGTWWTTDPRYVRLFRGAEHFNVKMSIINLDAALAKRVEPGVPSPQERLAAMRRIARWKAGGVTLRLRPFIVGVSSRDYIQLLEQASDAGADAVSVEFMCAEMRSMMFRKKAAALSRFLGFDLIAFYQKYSNAQGYLRLNRNVKRPYIDKMEETCKRLGMRFYVSDAHFKERCANGCCCGLTSSWNYSRGQWGEALQIAKATGRVRWSDIAGGLDHVKRVRFGTAHGFNKGPVNGEAAFRNLPFGEFFHRLWNSPKSKKSPYYQFEGVLAPDGLDEKGDVIYAYKKDRA